jgi:hypothetical protein
VHPALWTHDSLVVYLAGQVYFRVDPLIAATRYRAVWRGMVMWFEDIFWWVLIVSSLLMALVRWLAA